MAWAVDPESEAGSVACFRDGHSEVEALEEKGIDDLAKYRVILHLLQHPWQMGDAEFFATTLGFHSRERTRALLDEMVQAGLLNRYEAADGRSRYGLSPDSTLRQRLSEGLVVDRDSPAYDLLLRRLAQRSVARAKRGARSLQAS